MYIESPGGHLNIIKVRILRWIRQFFLSCMKRIFQPEGEEQAKTSCSSPSRFMKRQIDILAALIYFMPPTVRPGCSRSKT